MAESAGAISTWAPMRFAVFRALWIAVLVSNVGGYMQTVGAQWLLVNQAHAAVLVALVTTADMLPDTLFGLVGGVLADIFDRRRLLIVVQLGMAVVAVALAILTFAGQIPPALLLILTFVLGFSSVLSNPAYQSLTLDLAPARDQTAAAELGSISLNLARVVGPALAGLLIALQGVAFVFALNALTFIFFGLVVAAWRPKASLTPELPEHFVSALRAGGRYVLNSRVTRRVLLRTVVFVLPASVLWALLPLVATQRLALGAAGYGLLLGAVGIGAVIGVVMLSRLHHRFSDQVLVAASGAVYAVALALLVMVPSTVAAVLLLLPAGAGWMVVLSVVNSRLELFLPAWIRARGLSVFQMFLFGAQAIGAVLWGGLADVLGVVPAFLIATLALVVGVASFRFWPFFDTGQIDSRTVAIWPEPELAIEPQPNGGPVVIENVYNIASAKEDAFFESMSHLRRSRMRTGATWWGLFRVGEKGHKFVEMYSMPSWEEHLRQHRYRLTGRDATFDTQARELSDPPSHTSHLISVDRLP
jgi:MFS family permease